MFIGFLDGVMALVALSFPGTAVRMVITWSSDRQLAHRLIMVDMVNVKAVQLKGKK